MINVAVIGIGNMGKHHVRNYSNLENVNLVAVCDLDENIGKEMASKFSCKYYKDYKKMFEEENIDAVSIVVPTKFHKNVAIYSLDQNKHVLLEKPISDNVKDAEEIMKKAEEKNKKLMIGHIERFNPAVVKLKEIIDQGKLGKIISIIARRVGPFPPRMKDSNVIIDSAVHDIDVINYLLNKKPTSVSSYGNSILDSVNSKDCAELLLRYSNVTCFIQVNWVTPIKIRNLSVTGTLGYAELDYVDQKLIMYKNFIKKELTNFLDVVNLAKLNKNEINIEKEEPLSVELKSFIGCIENDIDPLVSVKDGLDALEIAMNSIENINKNEK